MLNYDSDSRAQEKEKKEKMLFRHCHGVNGETLLQDKQTTKGKIKQPKQN